MDNELHPFANVGSPEMKISTQQPFTIAGWLTNQLYSQTHAEQFLPIDPLGGDVNLGLIV